MANSNRSLPKKTEIRRYSRGTGNLVQNPVALPQGNNTRRVAVKVYPDRVGNLRCLNHLKKQDTSFQPIKRLPHLTL